MATQHEGKAVILVCGENLIDMIPRDCGGEIGYIPRTGGSPLNVAIGLGRLEVPTAFLSSFSHDRFGRMLRERLAQNGVDLRYIRDGDGLTTLALVHVQEGGEPEYGFYGEGTADRLLAEGDLPASLPDEVLAMHFGSISLLREPGVSTYELLMRREHGRRVLCLDPNVRPGLITDRVAYLERLGGWLSLMDLVKISRADLEWLYPDREPVDVAREWLGLGPVLIVVTRGPDGAIGLTRGVTGSVAGRRVTVSDTVGAGDAFTSGLLAWLHDGGRLDRDALAALSASDMEACLSFADGVAALTCTRAGAEPPTRAELAARG